jgi:hypothetical protein
MSRALLCSSGNCASRTRDRKPDLRLVQVRGSVLAHEDSSSTLAKEFLNRLFPSIREVECRLNQNHLIQLKMLTAREEPGIQNSIRAANAVGLLPSRLSHGISHLLESSTNPYIKTSG